ncbi:Zn(2(+)) ABC transporter ATP binding subunit [Candidatus Xenohaliotis californiensis]|uniref:Zn(2(+)) ABC transporter ATP binding subunit n=1 Tax=Candidatus Xenohaliotis californiensis TaxID=84677 RepID=A0ABM9N888_9RICK|nr:Zn(2(+)) ABC transporter ATP binding subunit [Candidatus Xenohaliotis californiensis]
MKLEKYFIVANNITIKDGKKFILKDVSITIKENDFITIVGPNGAGKSTLLKCLMGFFTPLFGTIERLPRLRIGYTPQRFFMESLMPISVKDFLILYKKINKNIFNKIIFETNTAHLLKTPLRKLSEGELQKVLLARALLGEPNLLILDEPAQNLDIAAQFDFYKMLDAIYKKYKISILMVSHDLHMVMSGTTSVICLAGTVCCSGTPESIANNPAFTSLFGNSVVDIFSIYQHKHNAMSNSIINK